MTAPEHVRQLVDRDPEICGLWLYVEYENESARVTYGSVGMTEAHYRIFEQRQ